MTKEGEITKNVRFKVIKRRYLWTKEVLLKILRFTL